MCLPNSGSPWSFLVPDSCPSLLSRATGPLPGVICGSVVCHPVRRGSAERLAGCVRGAAGCVRGAGSSGSLFRDLCGCCGVCMGTGAGLPGGGKVCRGLCPVPAGSARVSAGICAGHWQGLRGSVQVCARQWRGCVRGSAHRTRPWRPPRRALRQRGIFLPRVCQPFVSSHEVPASPWPPSFLARLVFPVLVPRAARLLRELARVFPVSQAEKCRLPPSRLSLHFYILGFARWIFTFWTNVRYFSKLVLCLGVISWPFSVSPPFLCVGVTHTRPPPPPPLADPSQGPLVSAQLTSTSSLRAKL